MCVCHLRQCTRTHKCAISSSDQIAYCVSDTPSRWTISPDTTIRDFDQSLSTTESAGYRSPEGLAFSCSVIHSGQNTGNLRS